MTPTLLAHGRVLTARGRFERLGVLVRGQTIDALVEPAVEREIAGRGDVRVVEARGASVIPGFVDAHFHLVALALKELRCDLAPAGSARAVAERLRAWVTSHPGDEPVVGVDWDESGWSDPSPLTREALDRVSAERPVLARRVCCHVGVVNTAFLRRLAADDADSAFIDAATGVITEGAVARASGLTRPSAAAIGDALPGAVRALHALGVTGIHDIVEPANLDALIAGLRAAPPLRIEALFHADPDAYPDLAARSAAAPPGTLAPLGIKIFADGSLGARTAALHAPYADAPTRGTLLVEREGLARALSRCAEMGIACAVHAIGDRAVAMVAGEMQRVGSKDGRFRIEHAEIVGDAERRLLAEGGVRAVMQPNFVRNWGGEGGLYEQRLGRERWRAHNPFRALVSAGVEVAFSSDGMPAGPLYGLRGATHHPVEASRLDPPGALRCYTEAPERLSGRGAGWIGPGRLADLTVLSRDPVLGDADSVRVLATWVGGRQVLPAPADGPGKGL